MVQEPTAEDTPVGRLSQQLCDDPELGHAGHLIVAFSGGLDSTVLLYLLAQLKSRGRLQGKLSALHVNHGLMPEAEQWQAHCRAAADKLAVPLAVERVKVELLAGDSPEEAAREARYRVFAAYLSGGGLLLQAHHLDDQVETVLLNLLRGSGPLGLGGIPRTRGLGAGSILRPLLEVSREELRACAEQAALQWVDDYSNLDERYDRNFLRRSIVPRLRERWPGMARGLSRSAMLCSESAALLETLAALDLAQARGSLPNRLRLDVLKALPPARIRNLVKYWAASLREEFQGEEIPYQALMRCVGELIPAAEDASPVITWGRGDRLLALRRYRDTLYLLPALPPVPAAMSWRTVAPLVLPGALGSLVLTQGQQALPLLDVQFRRGGEKIRMRKRPERSVKQLLQEAGVPPWLRDRVPLLYRDGRLLAVADIARSVDWPAHAGEIVWSRAELHCGY